MDKRGGVFYIIDAFLASGIITIALIVVLSSVGQPSPPDDAKDALTNYMNYFEYTKIYSAPGDIVDELYEEGLLSDQRANLFEAVTELMIHGNFSNATNLVEEQTLLILPVQFGMSLYFDDKLVYNKSYEKYNDAEISFTRKQVMTWLEPAKTKTKILSSISDSETPFDNYCKIQFSDKYRCVDAVSGTTSQPDLCHKESSTGVTYDVYCSSFEEAKLHPPSVIEVTIWL